MQTPGTNDGTITIGKQIWAARNLDVTTFRNGDPILEPKSQGELYEISEKRKPICCALNFDGNTIAQYGRFYNGVAVKDPRGLAPEGWHIPTEEEFREAIYFLQESWAGHKMKSTDGWANRGNGTNESGFNGFPGGYCTESGYFVMQNSNGFWWGSSMDKNDMLFTMMLQSDSWFAGRYFYGAGQLEMVRCIKD